MGYYPRRRIMGSKQYGNVQMSVTLTRNNCPSDTRPTQATYIVPAGKWKAKTQIDADALAQADLNANGQAYANTNGSCILRYTTAVQGPSHGFGYTAFEKGIMLPNGLILCIPSFPSVTSRQGYLGLYNSASNTFALGPKIGNTARPIMSAVLLPNGDVITIPYMHTHIGKYDYTTNTYTNLCALPTDTGNYFYGSVLMQDGNIMLVPYTRRNIGIYNVASNTFTVGPQVVSTNINNYSFEKGQILPNGKVLLIPCYSKVFGIYDPVTNTYSDGPAHNLPGANNYFNGGSLLLPNGKVMMVPRRDSASSNSCIGLYDYATNTYSNGAVTPFSALNYPAFLPNGKITFGINSGSLYFYDYLTDTLDQWFNFSASRYIDVVLDQNNDLVMIPNGYPSEQPFMKII